MKLSKVLAVLGVLSLFSGLAAIGLPQPKRVTAQQSSDSLLALSLDGRTADASEFQARETNWIANRTGAGRSAHFNANGNLLVRLPVQGSAAQDLNAFLEANRGLRVRDSENLKVDIVSLNRSFISGGRVSIDVGWKSNMKLLQAWFSKDGNFGLTCSYWSDNATRYLQCPMPEKVRKHLQPGPLSLR